MWTVINASITLDLYKIEIQNYIFHKYNGRKYRDTEGSNWNYIIPSLLRWYPQTRPLASCGTCLTQTRSGFCVREQVSYNFMSVLELIQKHPIGFSYTLKAAPMAGAPLPIQTAFRFNMLPYEQDIPLEYQKFDNVFFLLFFFCLLKRTKTYPRSKMF